ncbi:hypothetical protein N7468_005710 [Penicillium chermesinum]|uniref:Uncharacterized protein n=1 Tax=Penicillium chermesinum TaxID=63820 RepID=A0A9W9NZT5_9EURO|nr:uncharacterized protein N7468_005710 [Penicillium chermesinum]KAJ5232754.1 hypothetical protein N7468_005710 [Penicillium chermesinum]KAJ6172414.1 hypothetical protein N7470_001481 [Penicillium chermesinum]
MTGIFTSRNFALEDTPSLHGQIAVITGGQSGIGQEITAQLLHHGIEKVIVVARSKDKFLVAQETWGQRLGQSFEDDSRLEFVACDLGDINDVRAATDTIKRQTDKIHILFCNAGLGVPYEYKHSPQGIDHVFATNCVGHQALVTLLLPELKRAVSTSPNGARVVVTSSSLHLCCRNLDFGLLKSHARVKTPALYDGIWRYGRSKLGNILFAKELSRRLLEDSDPASRQIYVNAYFPGNIVTDQWQAWNLYFGRAIGSLMRFVASFLGQSVEDGAATALFLAASEEVSRTNSRGRYFVPIATLQDPSEIAKDEDLGANLWEWIDEQITATLGIGWKNGE